MRWLVVASLAAAIPADSPPCEGEFTRDAAGVCTMLLPSSAAGGAAAGCKAGQYLCPSDQQTCVASASEYTSCPNLKGTHLDWTLDIEQRLDYLLAHTNLTTQVAQLQNSAPEITHLGIPSYQFLNDDQHGVARATQRNGRGPVRATVFPNGCALGATWSTETLHEVGRVLGTEARGVHNGITDSQRSVECNGCGGRAQETYGEDPLHMSELVAQFVQGAQDNSNTPAQAPNKHLRVGMCCKHFGVYSVEGGASTVDRSWFHAEVTSRDFWESYMPAFHSCVVKAQATHVMCSYNWVNGVPACANKGMLTDVLRNTWNFTGFVVSDYDAYALIWLRNYSKTLEDAAAVGLNAGLDQEGGGNGGPMRANFSDPNVQAISQLSNAIASGKTTEAAVAQAMRRLFRVRIKLGMLDPPRMVKYNALRYNATELEHNEAHLAVARRAALEAMTLLKNDNATLPLRPKGLRRVAVVGVQANISGYLGGNYAENLEQNNWGASILTALTDRLSVLEPGCSVGFAPGLDDLGSTDERGFPAAKQLAAKADAVIVVLGLAFNSFCHGGGTRENGTCTGPCRSNSHCEGEAKDRTAIELPPGQAAMVAAVHSALGPGVPLIGLLVHGGAIGFSPATLGQLDAVLDAWQPGIEGGHAIAATLVGDSSPAGRTAVTWYRRSSDIPRFGYMGWYPNATEKSRGRSYRFFTGDVLWPFGFGLSYTSFAYSGLALATQNVRPCDTVKLTVTVRNVGAVDSDEVVQAYVKHPHASVPVPQVRLAAFERVHIAAGSSATVALSIPPSAHSVVTSSTRGESVYNASGSQRVEAGRVEIFVGGGQPDFFAGHVAGAVTVSGAAALTSCG